ncbi:MAG TPA: hypothetical protein VN612_04005 [Acidobacteriaceae bacterium]|nr:hypothetical protein [Acidobacteriaceae bacterium]
MPQKTVKVVVWVCARCGHEWQSKNEERPVRCSGCKSPYWDREPAKAKPAANPVPKSSTKPKPRKRK